MLIFNQLQTCICHLMGTSLAETYMSYSLTVQSFWILAGTATLLVHADSEHPQHAQWATCMVNIQGYAQDTGCDCPGLTWFERTVAKILETALEMVHGSEINI